jgi:hypothetical protein
MKIMSTLVAVILSLAPGFTNAEPRSDADQCKFDLVGQTMGGRERCWKFQSPDQVKELVIQNRREDAQQRVYFVTLVLQDPRVPGKYKAEAQVVYERVGNRWKIEHVGLTSIAKSE